MSLLNLRDVTMRFRGQKVVDRVSLTLEEGERCALVGPPGSGKSTLLALISGALTPTLGTVEFDGEAITGLPEARRTMLGIVRVLQHSTPFVGLTCCDNVELAVRTRRGGGSSGWLPARTRIEIAGEAGACLERVDLAPLAEEPTSALSLGEERRLALAMALAARPRLLLLDAFTAGLTAAEGAGLARMIRGLPNSIAVLLVERDPERLLPVASRMTVLTAGVVTNLASKTSLAAPGPALPQGTCIRRYPVETRDLIKADLIQPGATLTARRCGKTFSATVKEDGCIEVASGETFTAPSTAGGFVLGGQVVNGWEFWKVETPTGPVALKDIRDLALASGFARKTRPQRTGEDH
ncbi:ABC-type branched-subunit amino acid transport system ATPase component [Nonomuraea muscovyensis]|uniref:ABC-type branched-subunit amino acid transport system ATPase component n=1 Tax=Nonomuraea muscovyensis TaxID=1124761 RepID=A0A7X0EWQ0_9ACTN|nr:ATP-binding cassette domain-containing protein [Nonomuraea muscovyensis]MBB6344015.1 ABC-type branched-subunit amino acid transport system ATPase component [Nonomuraea muscovyensis]